MISGFGMKIKKYIYEHEKEEEKNSVRNGMGPKWHLIKQNGLMRNMQ